MTTNPAPGNDALTAELEKMARRSGRVMWVVIATQGLVLILAVVAITALSAALLHAEHRITADEARTAAAFCDAQFTIGTAPLPPATTAFGVSFVEASRKAFAVLNCPGRLPPPSQTLIRLGIKYHIPVRY